MVQFMLYMTGVSLCYWSEAFTYAVYIWNFYFTTMLNGVVSYKT